MKYLEKGSATIAIIALIGAALLGGLGAGQINKQHQIINEQAKLLELEEQLRLMDTYNALGAFRPSNYSGKLLTRLNDGGSETTFKTTPGTAADGSTLTTAKIGDFVVFTINPGGSNEEKISASAVSVSGTTATWTIINRGLSFTENAQVTANIKQHAIGERVIISNDDHYLNVQYGAIDEDVALIGSWTAPDPTADQGLATKTYVDTNVNGGAVSIDRVVPKAIAGETVSAGQLVYFDDTDDEWKLTDADTTTTIYNVPLGIAQGAGTDGNAISGGVLIAGLDANQSGLTKGDILYASNTAGAIATSTGTNSRIIGRAYDADEIYFIPSAQNYEGLLVSDNTFSGANTYTSTSTFSGHVNLNGTVSSTKPIVQVYTASTTWSKPAGLQYAEVWACGAGGGGGGAGGLGAGGGGGGGGCAYELLTASDLSATSSVAVTIGVGGAAGTTSGTDGSAGGTTSFSSFLSGTGGAGGDGETGTGGTQDFEPGGAGGAGSGGDLNLPGSDGAGGTYGGAGATIAIGGGGGSCHLGEGAPVNFNFDGAGTDGELYCGGGSGGAEDDSTGQAGGNGANGVVIITEYY